MMRAVFSLVYGLTVYPFLNGVCKVNRVLLCDGIGLFFLSYNVSRGLYCRVPRVFPRRSLWQRFVVFCGSTRAGSPCLYGVASIWHVCSSFRPH